MLWQVVAIFGTNYGPIGTVVTAKYTTNRALTSVVSASAALNASYVSSGPCSTWLLALTDLTFPSECRAVPYWMLLGVFPLQGSTTARMVGLQSFLPRVV